MCVQNREAREKCMVNMDNSKAPMNLFVVENVCRFREQALCIKSNIQVLNDIWELQPYFKEKRTGAFYKIVQDNCIFRVILETYKMLYDTMKNSATIYQMTNDVYREMIKMETFNDRQRELLDRKKKLVSDLNQYKDVENVIKASRNKVYAHNDLNYHWFKDAYVEKWGMTEQIYDDILTITNICIDYCNGILKLFNQRLIYEYSNHDDVKHLFGLKTDRDEEKEILEQLL